MSDDNQNEAGGSRPEAAGGDAEAPAALVDPTAGKTVAEIFGEIVWLMTQDKTCADLKIGDLEALVMPAILLRQFHIVYAQVATGRTAEGEPVYASSGQAGAAGAPKPVLQPVKVEIFAMVSEEVAARLDAHPDGSAALTLPEWRSGSQRKTIRIVSNAGAA